MTIHHLDFCPQREAMVNAGKLFCSVDCYAQYFMVAYFDKVSKVLDQQLQTVLPHPSSRPLDMSEKRAIFEVALLNKWVKENGTNFIWGDLWRWYEQLTEMIGLIPDFWNHQPRLFHILTSTEAKHLMIGAPDGTVLLRPASRIGFLALDQKLPAGLNSTLCKILSGGEIRVWYSHGSENFRNPGAFLLSYPSCQFLYPNLPKADCFNVDGTIKKDKK